MRLFILENLFVEPLHGYGIMKRIWEKSGGFWIPKAGFIYPLLNDMAREGLIAPARREDRRKPYAITDRGKAELLKLHREAEEAVIHLTRALSSNEHEPVKTHLRLLEQLPPEERAQRINSRLRALEALITTLSKMREELKRSVGTKGPEG